MSRIRDMVRHHHEFYDGTGYPAALSRAADSLGARIIAIADAYDTITSERTYKKGRAPSKTLSPNSSAAPPINSIPTSFASSSKSCAACPTAPSSKQGMLVSEPADSSV